MIWHMKKRVVVKVPATTANLGPGFDSLGMALSLFNTIDLEACTGSDCKVDVVGEGANSLPHDNTNLVVRSMKVLFERAGYNPPAWRLRMHNRIPLARGLGSSAAAIVGGLVTANAYAGNPFTSEQLLTMAVEIEGHPDNVSAALLGGLVIIVKDGDGYIYKNFNVPRGLKAYAVIPGFQLATSVARSVLPKKIPMADVVFNIGRVALLATALRDGNWDLLAAGMQDKVHQPYRSDLIPGLTEAFVAAMKAGSYGAVTSGAGPTVIAFGPPDFPIGQVICEVFKAHGITAETWEMDPSPLGTHIILLDG